MDNSNLWRNMELKIKKRKIDSARVFVIAEVGQAHDGSLGTAHAYIEAIARTGADAVKFQTHIAAAESSPEEPWRVKFSFQDQTRYDYWQRMEFTPDQWRGLYDHASDCGLAFISSPFSTQAVDLLEESGIDAFKIASGEVSNSLLLDRVSKARLPVLLSSGMSPISETDSAIAQLDVHKIPFAVFQCSSYYPCPPQKIGLNMLHFFRERYHCPVGLSDHSGKIFPSLASTSIGANLLEVHVAFSRDTFGPDVSSSVTIEEMKLLVEGVRYIEIMRSEPVDKDYLAQDLEPMRQLFTKSIAAACKLKAGEIIKRSDLTVKKPGTGIPAEKLDEMVGCCLARDVEVNQIIIEKDIKRESQ